MPVTPTFSEDFYKKLGHGIAGEFVNWFNQAHSAFRTDLKDVNELNYARFESKLEQRIAELRATLREEVAQMAAALRQEISGAERRVEKNIVALRADVRSLKSLVRWLFGFWAASTVTVLAAIIRLAGT